ncbi:methyltransferase [Colletotrichum fioriniae PJ7]|uniref:Methyltransferase n=1 Tax=Colletotrichum fioriniae PJ7 TaxID=1445577 RepID=A0A010R173_9PEZI|nr:methyltransferase [Colletotrichum fioriniae PJ7]
MLYSLPQDLHFIDGPRIASFQALEKMSETSTQSQTKKLDTAKGADAYNPSNLKTYDTLVFGVVSPYGWNCSAEKLISFFNRNIARAAEPYKSNPGGPPLTRILDIGVGTGYFPARAPLPKWTEYVLVDLNETCLDVTLPVIERAHPEVGTNATKVVGDFLAQGDDSKSLFAKGNGLPEGGFDAISLMFLLHCLPGPPARKAEALGRMGRLLRPGGVVFGATILGKGVSRNPLARLVLWLNNYLGVFDNHEDDAVGILVPLQKMFNEVRYEVVGCMLLFEASDPRCY